MELIERYIEEIRTYLPRSVREDVSNELRSNLEESVEARARQEPDLPREEIEAEALRELGPPHELADSYVPRPRVLFGPRLYPAFIRTLKIALAALVALAALGLFVELRNDLTLAAVGEALLSAVGGIVTGFLTILGIAVVVFSALERTTIPPEAKREEWDPRSLPQVEDPDKIKLGDLVASIAFIVLALVVLNLFRDSLGAWVNIDDERGWIPFLGPAFDAQLWLLNLCLILDLLVNFIVLLKWRWSLPLRWANLAVNSLYLTWLGRIAFGPPIIAADPAWMAERGWSAEAISQYEELFSGLSRVVSMNLKIGVYVACALLVWSLLKLLYRTFSRH